MDDWNDELNGSAFDAVAFGNIKYLQEAVLRGFDVNAPNILGNDALSVASMNGKDECVRYLLSVGATNGSAAIYSASLSGRLSSLQILLDAGFNPSIVKENHSALEMCAQRNHLDCAKLLIQNGCALHHESLCMAITFANARFVRLLVDLGCPLGVYSTNPMVQQILIEHSDLREALRKTLCNNALKFPELAIRNIEDFVLPQY